MKLKNIKTFEQHISESNTSDITPDKLTDGKFYAIQEDGGDQLFFRGIYNNLDMFINHIKSKLISEENIQKSDIIINFDRLDNRNVILVRYGHSEDIFYYDEVGVNEINGYDSIKSFNESTKNLNISDVSDKKQHTYTVVSKDSSTFKWGIEDDFVAEDEDKALELATEQAKKYGAKRQSFRVFLANSDELKEFIETHDFID